MEMNMLASAEGCEGKNSPKGMLKGDRVETHWSRILYCDFMSRAGDARISSEVAACASGRPVDSRHSPETHETKPDRR
jgi:hypothetical protein